MHAYSYFGIEHFQISLAILRTYEEISKIFLLLSSSTHTLSTFIIMSNTLSLSIMVKVMKYQKPKIVVRWNPSKLDVSKIILLFSKDLEGNVNR